MNSLKQVAKGEHNAPGIAVIRRFPDRVYTGKPALPQQCDVKEAAMTFETLPIVTARVELVGLTY